MTDKHVRHFRMTGSFDNSYSITKRKLEILGIQTSPKDDLSTKASPEHLFVVVFTLYIPTLGEPRCVGIFIPSDKKD